MATTRRKLLIGGIALGAGAMMLRPGDQGKNHSQYFRNASRALDEAGLSRPTLLVDKTLLRENIRTLQSHINGRSDYRIVAKSLPSLPMLKTVMHEADTNRLMLFHQPFINQVTAEMPSADLLLGKPMPVQAARNFYQSLTPNAFDPSHQLQWLIDTPQRLAQYAELAASLQTRLRINIELNVGLQRGGVEDDRVLAAMLRSIEENPLLEFSGFMGYEPHIVKVPGDPLDLRDKAQAVYSQRIKTAEQTLGRDISNLTLNTGGSPSYQLYDKGNFVHNELATGSCLVKATDFDIETLSDHKAAAFIATPVIKSQDETRIPGVDGLGKAMGWWNPNRAKTVFTYGGYWKSQPHSPQGLSSNPVFGRSTNQEMYNHSESVALNADDWVFFRPTQSEFVLLQFGDIAVMENGRITDLWPVLKAS